MLSLLCFQLETVSGASLETLLVKNLPAMQETLVRFLDWEDPLGRAGCPLQYSWASLASIGSDGREFACNAGDLGWIPGLGRSPGEGHGNPLKCSCLENPVVSGGLQSVGSHIVAHD